MLSLFYFVFWCIMQGADFARPSALHRAYVLFWLFILSWALLVAATVYEDRQQIASGYLIVFWASQVFLALLISLLDMFGLPKKKTYARNLLEDHEVRGHLDEVPHSDALISPGPDELDDETAVHDDEEEAEAEPSETTPLFGGNGRGKMRTTFATGYRRSMSALSALGSKQAGQNASDESPTPFGAEQPWSGSLVSWTWFIQYLILAPFMINITAQVAMVVLSAVHQTGQDGSALLPPYLMMATFTILLLLPITPFVHRVTHHIPVFCMAIFAGTLIYCLAAFPFSSSSPYKVFFQQTVDLDSGANKVIVTGREEWVRRIVADIPSASGQDIACADGARSMSSCEYSGDVVPPALGGGSAVPGVPQDYSKLVTVNISRSPGKDNSARFVIDAVDTKTCTLKFDRPVTEVHVNGSAGWNDRFDSPPGDGDWKIETFTLWRRDWSTPWTVDVRWGGDGNGASLSAVAPEDVGDEAARNGDLRTARAAGLDGTVVCRWSDVNTRGLVPAYDELLQYMPKWATATQMNSGLVEGKKRFMA